MEQMEKIKIKILQTHIKATEGAALIAEAEDTLSHAGYDTREVVKAMILLGEAFIELVDELEI